MDIWRESFPLRFGAVDRSDRLTLWSTFDFFQEAAISHAEALGVGREDMKISGQAWVLSRLSVFWERRPLYGETVTVRSWPRGSEKLFAVRDYDIRDAEDRPVVRGRSGWLVLDMEKRRPLRVQQLMEKLPLNAGENAFSAPSPALAARENLVRSGERRAAYSDVDYNGHVNNTRYVQWVQDLADFALLEDAEQMRFDINYLSEVKPGEVTGLWTAPIAEDPPAGPDYPRSVDAALAFEGRRPESDQPVFRAELRVKSGRRPAPPLA
ncbi:MAG: acyl-ACP thioesterase [Treponema sp.]|jgi:acyl-ACP thioesterase|nr:acyl-ACP thioesterase [Treponema sp.]